MMASSELSNHTRQLRVQLSAVEGDALLEQKGDSGHAPGVEERRAQIYCHVACIDVTHVYEWHRTHPKAKQHFGTLLKSSRIRIISGSVQ